MIVSEISLNTSRLNCILSVFMILFSFSGKVTNCVPVPSTKLTRLLDGVCDTAHAGSESVLTLLLQGVCDTAHAGSESVLTLLLEGVCDTTHAGSESVLTRLLPIV